MNIKQTSQPGDTPPQMGCRHGVQMGETGARLGKGEWGQMGTGEAGDRLRQETRLGSRGVWPRLRWGGGVGPDWGQGSGGQIGGGGQGSMEPDQGPGEQGQMGVRKWGPDGGRGGGKQGPDGGRGQMGEAGGPDGR